MTSVPKFFHVECVKCARCVQCIDVGGTIYRPPTWIYADGSSTHGVCSNCLVELQVEVSKDMMKTTAPSDEALSEIFRRSYEIARAHALAASQAAEFCFAKVATGEN